MVDVPVKKIVRLALLIIPELYVHAPPDIVISFVLKVKVPPLTVKLGVVIADVIVKDPLSNLISALAPLIVQAVLVVITLWIIKISPEVKLDGLVPVPLALVDQFVRLLTAPPAVVE
jgi:hypothetical protein